ncbi:MAG: peptide ABC transporter substrate-binding protein [Dehalococcoidales bacterium]|nr:peptide ABC transporter substrate-binding protein [Dehalococcoidales bacterium]
MLKRASVVFVALVLVIAALVASQGLVSFETEQTIAPATAAGVLRLAWGEPETLDPALANDVDSLGFLLHIHSGLVRLNNDMEVAPALASSWQLSPDGRTYTFTLREGARFQDGRPVTAADVKYSLERATDPALKSQVAATYLGDIVGVREKLAGQAGEVQGVKVIDERTVAITIDEPKVYFLAKLTYPTASVVDRQNVASGADWAKHPNGAGPFKLVSWDKDWIVLERSEYYWGTDPSPRQVEYYIGPRSPMAMYEGNELDVIQVGLGDIERVLDPRGPLHDELVVSSGLSLYYVGLNVDEEPFQDRAVRRALARAIDKDKIVNVTMKGTVVRADGVLPPGLLGHDPSFRGLTYDLEAAENLLKESFYGGPDQLPPITFTGGMGELFAEAYWRNLGVPMVVQVVQEGYYEGLDARAYQMFLTGWLADYADPENFLDLLFHSQSQGNHTGYSNPEVDSLLEQARVEKDEGKRVALYRQVERIVVDDAAIIPLFFDVSYDLVKPRVHGLDLTPLGIITYEGITLD